MNKYKPGSSFRISLTSEVQQVLTDPSNSVVTMRLPDGTTPSGTPIKDSTGLWHADMLIPFGTPPGVGVYRWQSTGVAASQNGLAENRFQVLALDF
jgi:hypothetical protein